MSEEPDPQLLRWFAESRAALDDAHFTEQVIGRINRARGPLFRAGIARSVAAASLSGIFMGLAAPLRLRLRRAALLALVGAAVTLCAGLLSP